MMIATRIREARQAAHLTQEELARKAGLHQYVISALENNKRPNVTVTSLHRICDVLHVSADYLLGRTTTKQVA